MLQSPFTPPIGVTSSISSSGGDLSRVFLCRDLLRDSFHLIRRCLELSSGDSLLDRDLLRLRLRLRLISLRLDDELCDRDRLWLLELLQSS
mmetsp:Transcript_12588/g.19406  ORF Transcript_12588/g.19406 Transcript_12588/m.19406 type:complete len:91 (+) Transcript_12588:143-415(+)